MAIGKAWQGYSEEFVCHSLCFRLRNEARGVPKSFRATQALQSCTVWPILVAQIELLHHDS